MHREINKTPKDIEELVKIKKYMEALPFTIEQTKTQIEENMLVFNMLEEFHFKFNKDDMDKK